MSYSFVFSESLMETADERYFDSDWADPPVIRHTQGRTLRKSCNRCHQQKLRCVGDKTSLTRRCIRCQRAGLDCVYSPRSSNQQNKHSNDNWDNRRTQPLTPTSNPLAEIDTIFGPELSYLNDILPRGASSSSGSEVASLANYALPSSQSASTSEISMSTPRASPNSSTEAAVGLIAAPSDLSGGLANVCQTLEAIFRKVTRDHTKQGTQDYPIGEVFGAFDSLLRVLALDDMGAISTSRPPQSPLDEYLRSKQASMAAQCYVLCIKLMAFLSEQMLQSLLAMPLPTTRSGSGNLNTSESTQSPNALEAQEDTFSNTSHVPENLRLGDLYVPPDPFGHALKSAISMLQIGSRSIGMMEKSLGIPPEQGGGSLSPVTSSDQAGPDHHTTRDGSSSGLSFPARFVALIWEVEASMNNKSPVGYFRRCRAAIIGLSKHHF
ncbi:hypothetical protein F4677DRAFT_461568 [Hypoxylon crocopeplum]|nr:hypothetical protein F4677DRAFT_461568 [Hypoxylon crocopeplum]